MVSIKAVRAGHGLERSRETAPGAVSVVQGGVNPLLSCCGGEVSQ